MHVATRQSRKSAIQIRAATGKGKAMTDEFDENQPWIGLLNQAEEGDNDAMSELILRAKKVLVIQGRRAGAVREDLSDAVQQSLLKFWRLVERRGVEATIDNQVVALLREIAGNVVVNQHRDRHRGKRDEARNENLNRDVESDLSSPSTRLRREEESRIRLAALESLPARDQRLLKGRKEENLTWEEVSVEHSLSVPSVQRAYHRALERWVAEARARGASTFIS